MTSNARSFQVPGEQLEPSNGPVMILWDIENCQVPSDVRPEDVAGNIRMALRSHPVTKGAVTMFSAYGDFTIFPRRIREGCQRTGIKLVDVPNGRKDAADMAIVVDMFLFALDSPPPSTIMLISGDIDFAQALHVLGQRGYTIVLISPTGRTVSPALSNAARFIWDWSSVVHGIGFISSEASTASAINFNRGTFTLQDEKATVSHYKSEQSGCGNYKQLMEDISDVPNCSSKYGGTIIAASSFPIFRCYCSLASSIGASGKLSKHDALKDQPLVAQGLKGLLQRSLSPVRVKLECHKIFQWLLCAISFGACKFAILFKLMKDVANSVGKGNLLLHAHFDKPEKADKKMGRDEMNDKEVLSDSVSLLDTVGFLDDDMAVRCSPGTDLLASGIRHSSNQINNTTHFCANCFTRKMPQEIKSTHSTGCESKKRYCNGEEVVEKQKQEKKLKTSVLWKIKDGQTASDFVVDKKSNTRTENEIRTREITSQTFQQLQHGEDSTSDMEVNSLQSEEHHVFRNVYNGTEVCNLPKLGNEYGNIDKVQGFSTVAATVGHIISPDTSLPKNLTTAKQMQSIELKSNVSTESESGVCLESIGWCEICSVDCKSKVVLDQHKQGKKHKNTLLKLDEANRGPNAIGFIELKTDNLTCSKDMLMETRSAECFVFEAGVDVGTKISMSNNTIQSALCKVLGIDIKTEEVLGSYSLSNEKENFEKNLKNDKGDPAVDASPSMCDNMKSGMKISMEAVISDILSVTKVEQKETTEHLKNATGDPAVDAFPSMCDNMRSGVKTSMEVINSNISSVTMVEEKETTEGLKNAKGDPAVGAIPSMCDNRKSGVKTSMEVVSSNISSVTTAGERETTEGLKNAKGDPAVGAFPSMCDNVKSGMKTSMGVVSSNISSVTKVEEKETTEGLKNAKGDPAVGASPAMRDKMKIGMETSMEIGRSNIFSVTKVEEKETTEHLTWCNVCCINCFSEMVLTNHLRGKKHKKKLEKMQKVYNVSSVHLQGKKHKKKLEKMQKVNNVSSVHIQGKNYKKEA